MPVNHTRYAVLSASTNFSMVLDAFENEKITDSGRRAQAGFAGVAKFRSSVVLFECHKTWAHPLDVQSAAIPSSWIHLSLLQQLRPSPPPRRTRLRAAADGHRWSVDECMVAVAPRSECIDGLWCSRMWFICVQEARWRLMEPVPRETPLKFNSASDVHAGCVARRERSTNAAQD